MGRKKALKKQTVNVSIDGALIPVTLTPPTGKRRTWYAYWNGLKSSRSTKQQNFDEAVEALPDMIGKGGRRSQVSDVILSDEEFEEIQRRHYAKKTEPAARERSMKSLRECLDAIAAFKAITGLSPITIATPEDCERFQQLAEQLPRNWRSKHPRSRDDPGKLSPATIVKWSVALQAAFERANRNGGKKCVRSVVTGSKLLEDNPWKNFTWITNNEESPLRQFDQKELVAFLDLLQSEWPSVSIGPLMAKLHLWSASRRAEIAGLEWRSLRKVAGEYHFRIVGKWGVVRWFRIPESVFVELESIRTDSPYVFGAFPEQLRSCHANGIRPWLAKWVKPEFTTYNLGRWFYERISDWSKTLPNGKASTHVFRKTTLQYARRGEDVNRQVSSDACVSEAVMMSSYVREEDEELRQKSNRTFSRIRAALQLEVAERYGAIESEKDRLLAEFHQATEAKEWPKVAKIASQLASC